MCCTDWWTALVLRMSISAAPIRRQPPPKKREKTQELRTVQRPLVQVLLGDIPAALEQKLALAGPLVFQPARDADKLIALHVVEHDDVRARIDRLVGLHLGADLDLEQEAEPADFARLPDRIRDRAFGWG